MSSAKADKHTDRNLEATASSVATWPHANAGHEQHPLAEAPFYRSIRFRLTAWYAIILVLVLVAIGLTLSTMLQRALERDLHARLTDAASEVFRQTDAQIRYQVTPEGVVQQVVLYKTPQIDSILVSGMGVEVVDFQGNPLFTSGNFLSSAINGIQIDPTSTSTAVVNLRFTVGKTEVQAVERPIVKYYQLPGSDKVNALTVGAVFVGESRAPLNRTLAVVNRTLRISGIIGVALAIAIGWLLAGRALSPVERITRTANKIAQDRDSALSLTTRLEVPDTGDELARLSTTFNQMLDRLEESFATQRRFVADASHELRTPLTSIRGNVDVLLRQIHAKRPLNDHALAESLDDIQRESARMGRLIEDLLLLARTDSPKTERSIRESPVRLDLLARDACRTAEALVNGQRLVLHASTPIEVMGDSDRLTQVMLILLDNALRHTPAGGTVSLTVAPERQSQTGTAGATIEVRDTGEGIPADHLAHLFERFYRVEGARTRASGGTGLGLAIASALVHAHEGTIDVQSAPGQGSVFTVWLPMGEPAVIHEHAMVAEPAKRLGRAGRFVRRGALHSDA